MKKNWSNPQVKNLDVIETKEGITRDPGDIPFEHTHKCNCGKYFATWDEAQNHITEMAKNDPNGYMNYHGIGVVPIS